MQKGQAVLMSGSEAVAQGAWEAGVRVACGNANAEMMQCLAGLDGILCLNTGRGDMAIAAATGATAAGAHSIACLENENTGGEAGVIPLPGVNAGMVMVCAEAAAGRFKGLPVLEPADSGECLSFTKLAFQWSRRLGTPVLLRLAADVAHTRSAAFPSLRDESDGSAFSRKEENEPSLEAAASRLPVNRMEMRERAVGVIVSGCYPYVREALPNASTLKLGLTRPLPVDQIRAFASQVDRLMVVEEDSWIADQIRAAEIACEWESLGCGHDERSVARLRQALGAESQAVLPLRQTGAPAFNLVMTGDGQGVSLASRILGNLALQAGSNVTVYQEQGRTHVRAGDGAHSPIVEMGQADYCVALDETGTRLAQTFLKPDGMLIASRQPATAERTDARMRGIALLGTLSRHLSFSEKEWLHEIARCVPRKAFTAGAGAFRLGRGEMD